MTKTTLFAAAGAIVVAQFIMPAVVDVVLSLSLLGIGYYLAK